MSYGYGARGNAFDQRGDAPVQPYGGPQSPQFGSSQYSNAPAMGRDDYGGQNVEMAPLAQNGSQYGRQQDPNAILNECRDIDRAITDLNNAIDELTRLQKASLNSTSAPSGDNSPVAIKNTEIMAIFRNLTGRVKAVKQQPESGSPRNAPQVGHIGRKLATARDKYTRADADYRGQLEDQIARQYLIVRPDASDAEVREAVQDTGNNVFAQALKTSGRQGQASTALNAVQSRHLEIQKIEQQIIELAELFTEMENLVVQQEVAVTNIEMKGEEVVENMDKGTEEIGVAIQSAKNARKWKWWCLGISVLILVVIVVIILIYKFVIQAPVHTASNTATNSRNPRRFVLTDTHSLTSHRLVVPGLEWKGDDLSAIPQRKTRRFQA